MDYYLQVVIRTLVDIYIITEPQHKKAGHLHICSLEPKMSLVKHIAKIDQSVYKDKLVSMISQHNNEILEISKYLYMYI